MRAIATPFVVLLLASAISRTVIVTSAFGVFSTTAKNRRHQKHKPIAISFKPHQNVLERPITSSRPAQPTPRASTSLSVANPPGSLTIAPPMPTSGPLLAALATSHLAIFSVGPILYRLLRQRRVLKTRKERTYGLLACIAFQFSNMSEIAGHIFDGMEYGFHSSDGLPNVLFRVFMDTGHAFLAASLAPPDRYQRLYEMVAWLTFPISLIVGVQNSYRSLFLLRFSLMMMHILNFCINLKRRTNSNWGILYFFAGIPIIQATLHLRKTGNPVWHLFPTADAFTSMIGAILLSTTRTAPEPTSTKKNSNSMIRRGNMGIAAPVLTTMGFLLASTSLHGWLSHKLLLST